MNADAAIEWLEIEGFDQWRLFRGDGDGQKVSEFESSESQEEALNRLRRILPLQSVGKYTLKGWKGKSRQAAQSLFTFDIKPQPVIQAAPQGRAREVDFDELYRKAEEQAFKRLEDLKWRESVDSRLTLLEKGIEDLKKSMLELHDDNDDNDDDALERITNVAGKLPQIQNGLQSLRGMLKV